MHVRILLRMRTRKLSSTHLPAMDPSGRLEPVLVVVLCGKRKCGKDYVAARLQQMYVPIHAHPSNASILLSCVPYHVQARRSPLHSETLAAAEGAVCKGT